MVEAWVLIPTFFAGFVLAEVILLVFTCKHDYETRIHKVDCHYSDGTPKCSKWIYTQTCKYCGKIKTKVVGLKD